MQGAHGINCVKGEIHNVLTVLRIQQSTMQVQGRGEDWSITDALLMRGLTDLHEEMGDVASLHYLDTRAMLKPFLEVIVKNSPIADAKVCA